MDGRAFAGLLFNADPEIWNALGEISGGGRTEPEYARLLDQAGFHPEAAVSLRARAGSRRGRRGHPVLQAPHPGAAASKCRDCPGVRGVLPAWPILDAGAWLEGSLRGERENEIVIGTDENAPSGMCFMPVTDPKTVKNRVHLDLTSSAESAIRRLSAFLRSGRAGSTSARAALSPGLSLPTRRETSSA